MGIKDDLRIGIHESRQESRQDAWHKCSHCGNLYVVGAEGGGEEACPRCGTHQADETTMGFHVGGGVQQQLGAPRRPRKPKKRGRPQQEAMDANERASDAYEIIYELREFIEVTKDKIHEWKQWLRRIGVDPATMQRAEGYWMAHILGALDDERFGSTGGSVMKVTSTIEDLEEFIEELGDEDGIEEPPEDEENELGDFLGT